MKPFFRAPTLAVLVTAMAVATTVAAQRIEIVSERNAGRYWKPAEGVVRVTAGYPREGAEPGQDVCVNIGFLIHVEGHTSNFTQMKAWSSKAPDPEPALVQPFVQSAAAAVSMWKFQPVTRRTHAIYTSATFVFDGSKTLDAGQIRRHCEIRDLKDFVAEANRARDDLRER